MTTFKVNRFQLLIAGSLAITFLLISIPSTSYSQEMTISPHKIILNAKGQFDNVQAVIRIAMQPGYYLSDYQVTLLFNNIPVSEAYDLRYCYIDDNFLASFDRTALQANPVVIDMAGLTVIATVSGWFEAESSDGDSYVHTFSCTDMVEIIDPDKK